VKRRGFLKALAVGMAALSLAGGIPPAEKRKRKRQPVEMEPGSHVAILHNGEYSAYGRIVEVDHASGAITVEWLTNHGTSAADDITVLAP
jgi:anaerobic selenocysteine-containing dehydrogenase